jgi:trehalose 6-phosphate synthase
LINPYATDQFADAIKQGLEMSINEQEQRMRRLREVVQKQNIYRWAAKIISEILKFEFTEI